MLLLGFLSVRFVYPGPAQPTILSFFNTIYNVGVMKANKLFFLTSTTSELLKYLNEQLGVLLNVKEQKLS